MSVMDEIKEMEQEIRATLGRSFGYGFFAGLFLAIAAIDFLKGVWTGIWNAPRIITIITGVSGYLYVNTKQHLYATNTFHDALDSANDECTCGEECSCEKDFKGDKVEHL